MEIFDYHIHSINSFDGKNSVLEMCQRGIEIGIKEICFTEHFSVDPRDVSYGVLDYSKYKADIEEAKKIFLNKISVKIGLEIGEPHLNEYREELNRLQREMDLDFIIGSVHNINGKKLRLFMENKDKEYIYSKYFEEIYEMVNISDIDVIGHLDLMKRYAFDTFGNYDFQDYKNIIEKILKRAIERNIGIEINGSGYINSVGEPYPKVEVLEMYKKMGGEIITVGSDSHSVETLSINNKKMMELLKKIGFQYIYTFKNRNKIKIKI